MANLSPKKVAMPHQDALERSKNFDEVALGYTEEQAIEEANRCLHCKNKPCTLGCPVMINIPEFIAKVKDGDFEGAYQVIAQSSSLPAVCGRVCPQENQCEKHCVRALKGEPVAIGRLERFVADYHNKNAKESPKKIQNNGVKVAVVGSGPAGLACAGDLVKMGYDVTVFEAFHVAGGVLVYGIPEFRLPKKIIQKEIDNLTALGVNVQTNVVVGKTILFDELFDEYGFSAVFIGTGAGLPKFMNIEGENLNGVYSANEFLTRINLMKAYKDDASTPITRGKKVVVVGGGNVAMDAARCAKRLGADVHIVYRRTLEELPARKEEVEHAMEEGIIFDLLTNPTSIKGDQNGWVSAISCVKMQLGEPDASGRRSPVEIKNSDFEIQADVVIMALGTAPNKLVKNSVNGLAFNNRGGIITNESGQTSIPSIFAGGDAVTGAATVILAMGAGKNAAKAIDEYIKNESKG